jgi:hypothetical protein
MFNLKLQLHTIHTQRTKIESRRLKHQNVTIEQRKNGGGGGGMLSPLPSHLHPTPVQCKGTIDDTDFTYWHQVFTQCISPSWFDTEEYALRIVTFQSALNHWQQRWWCRVITNLVLKSNHFANSMVVILTMCAIKNYHWPIYLDWMICFICFVRLLYLYWFFLT